MFCNENTLNLRFHHATNSSSSHSMIIEPKRSYGTNFSDVNFGWSNFTLADRETKNLYLSRLFHENFKNLFEPLVFQALLKQYDLAENPPQIDHMSIIYIPKDIKTKKCSLDFFLEFRDYVLKDEVVILGGNDNSNPHPRYRKKKLVRFELFYDDYFRHELFCRRDGDWWTVYQPQSGNRATFTFKDNPGPFEPKTPFLVDVKITDQCDFGCSYCYQGSTPKGKSLKGSLFDIERIFKNSNALEVALGGGEPTTDPYFIHILEIFRNLNITPNFTTKNLKWLDDRYKAKYILDLVGNFAYSVGNEPNWKAKLDRLGDRVAEFKGSFYNPTIHVIPGIISKKKLENILQYAYIEHFHVTLLGFKFNGRGVEYLSTRIMKNERNWLDVFKDLTKEKMLRTLSVDTLMVQRYEQEILNSGVPSKYIHKEEGKYSMYIDLVDYKYGPSSYHQDLLQKLPDNNPAKLEKLFETINPVPAS